MTDPKNHDDEPEDITSSGEPDDADSDLDSTDDETIDEVDESTTDESADVVDEDVDQDTDNAADAEDDIDADEDVDQDDNERERKEKPVPAGKASRSGNPARAAEAESAPRSRTPVKPQKIGNRWAAPAMLACAAIGLLWIVLYYVFANRDNPVPLMSDLGDWNLIIGMGFIVAAFGFSMKWE
ncbi:MAG: cell division protein CrgA [Actinomycetia bacterium]|nr:cell division protein CrgA [Actinomycetes bacterium]